MAPKAVAKKEFFKDEEESEVPTAAKPLARLKKLELQSELVKAGQVVNPKWTVPELRMMVKELRDLQKPKQEDILKGMSSWTLGKLRARAQEEGLEFDDRTTRGMLMVRLRDHMARDQDHTVEINGETLFPWGRFKGWTFQEVLTHHPSYYEFGVAELPKGCRPVMRDFLTWVETGSFTTLTNISEYTPIPADPKVAEQRLKEAKALIGVGATTKTEKDGKSSASGSKPTRQRASSPAKRLAGAAAGSAAEESCD